MPSRTRTSILLLALTCAACGSDSQSADADAGSRSESTPQALHEVPCTDESVGQLKLFEPASPGAIVNEAKGSGFETLVDASAGGMTATQSFVYARFTRDGLEKVAIGDEDAFNSGDWHIAFRRYVIRLNSGVSGPAEITGARTVPGTDFESLTAPPSSDEVEYRSEAYFTESCGFINDGSGIGAPGTALASYWRYQECVQMTGNVFVVALPGEHHVKLQVLSYYSAANQRTCDATGKVPLPSGAGNLRFRWAFLD